MFVVKLSVEASEASFEAADKIRKSFQKLGKRHGLNVVVDAFGGDNSGVGTIQAAQQASA